MLEWVFRTTPLAFCFENRSIGFQRQTCFELSAMAFNLNAARQFHSLIGFELESKTTTCIQLNVLHCAELNAKWLLQTPPHFFELTWTSTHALRWTRCNALAKLAFKFNLNANFELNSSSICYLAINYKILKFNTKQVIAQYSETYLRPMSSFKIEIQVYNSYSLP